MILCVEVTKLPVLNDVSFIPSLSWKEEICMQKVDTVVKASETAKSRTEALICITVSPVFIEHYNIFEV